MKFVFMGDSTMQENSQKTYPQVGWPQALPLFFDEKIEYRNFAKNGCSTKSFIDKGYFNNAIESLSEGDYCFIEFGHNDQKEYDKTRYTNYDEYQKNLRLMIDEVRNKKAIPVLLTSIYRRCFNENGKLELNNHLDYPKKMIELANKLDVLVIDMTSLTFELIESLGIDNSKRLFMNFEPGIYDNYLCGKEDNTHLRFDGAYYISKLFVQELIKINHPLCKYLKGV